MAEIKFYVDSGLGGPFDIDMSGSGLGFYGAGGFGGSVAVGSYQDNTYVTDANGALQGPKGLNVKWRHAESGEVAGSTVLNVQDIPNTLATLNIRFTHTSAVQVQNCELRIYDRVAPPNAAASGVVAKTYETLHPSTLTTGVLGSGDTQWTTPGGSGVTQSLANSPGPSGGTAEQGTGSITPATQHDFYVCMSFYPDSIGSKTAFGLFCSLEYL